MNSVLMNAVLSLSPNYELFFDTLCWPAGEWPETERVEALTAFIDGLGSTLQDSTVVTPPRKCVLDKIESVIWSHCFPVFVGTPAGGESGRRETVSCVCRLVSACVWLCEEDVAGRVVQTALPSLQLLEEETQKLSVDVASDVISAVIPRISADKQLKLTTLSSALSCVKAQPVSKSTAQLLLTLLDSSSGEMLSSIRRLVLDDLCGWYSADQSPLVIEKSLLCLTALSDHMMSPCELTPSSSELDPRLRPHFWKVVQAGLTHRDTVTRKRALYLLKRCVALSEELRTDCPVSPSGNGLMFRWSVKSGKVLRDFWEDYVLVMETLEETQIHVVRPVLNRIDLLIQTTADSSQGPGLFHPSWLLCVYQRMFHSENKTLMKEGVSHLLELQVLQQPDFAVAFSEFVVGPFLDVVSETSLYYRSPSQSFGDCPELAVKLQLFLRNFFSYLPSERRGGVLLQMLRQLSTKHWYAVPILFITQALSTLPPCPLLDVDGLVPLRDMLQCTMLNHQVLLRGASQGFLLKSALCLLDVKSATLNDVFTFLTYFRADESLSRGTKLWSELCVWLSENEGGFKTMRQTCADTTKSTVRSYVQEEIKAFLRVPASTGHSEGLPPSREAEKMARSILLCADMEKSLSGANIDSFLETTLAPLLDTLSRVSTNIYLPLQKSDKSLQLVLRLLQFGRTSGGHSASQDDKVMVVIEKLVFKYEEPMQEFILRRLCGELQELCDLKRADLYLSVLKELVMYSPSHRHRSLRQTCFSKVIKYSLQVLQESSPQMPSVADQVAKLVAMATVAVVCHLIEQQRDELQSDLVPLLNSLRDYFYTSPSSAPTPLAHFNKSLVKPQTEDATSDLGAQGSLLKDWGRTASYFMRDQWVCLSFLLRAAAGSQSMSTSSDMLPASLSCSVEALSLMSSDLVLPVLTFMETLIPQVVHIEEALCVEAVSRTRQLVLGRTLNAQDFWPILSAFISMAFHPHLLKLTDAQAPKLTALLRQITTDLMEVSESKNGVFSVLLRHCCETWMPSRRDRGDFGDNFSSVFNHADMLTEAFVYGPVFRRDLRLLQDVQGYVELLGEDCAANSVVKSDNRDDQLPRICSIAFLSRLEPSNLLHRRLMEDLVNGLLKKDSNITKSVHYQSLQHRVKNRVWQTLLLLLPKLTEEFVAELVDRVLVAAFSTNHASVKYLIEWMIILILVRHPQHIDKFWDCFKMDHDRNKASICTFLSVLVHFNIILPALPDPDGQLVKALDIILQFCFNHNFSVRLYVLLALKKVWGLAEERAINLGGLSSIIQACLLETEAQHCTGNASKNWLRIQDHFFFDTFHPIRDYSVETIFYTFPRLSGMSDDEWLPPWKFEKMSCFSANPDLPLWNPGPELRQLPPGDWIQQDRSEEDKDERWTEVQKKIVPWRLGIQEQDPELQLVPQKRSARVGKLHGALLVVASLIDKPTNLGGLCRTCEIFGASALVLDSLRHINDKHFQSLSVSSELWLPLHEVKPVELTEFLRLKKREGYCIVGVEQTANSQSLQDFQFPEKSLLLLGNEREGIPANLLQLLDVCVEIPQQGIIRSLNVHVSAALLIWEYTRQHLIAGQSEACTKQP
ncbi:putative methyltransferase TARBP1 isoform 1-T1 [Synchiropus picturatus]